MALVEVLELPVEGEDREEAGAECDEVFPERLDADVERCFDEALVGAYGVGDHGVVS